MAITKTPATKKPKSFMDADRKLKLLARMQGTSNINNIPIKIGDSSMPLPKQKLVSPKATISLGKKSPTTVMANVTKTKTGLKPRGIMRRTKIKK